MATTVIITIKWLHPVEWPTDQESKMQTESSPLTVSASPSEATSVMMLSLALIQSGKILIFVQYPGNSHHSEEKRNDRFLRVQPTVQTD